MYTQVNTTAISSCSLPNLSKADFEHLASVSSLQLYVSWLQSLGFAQATIKSYHSWVRIFLLECIKCNEPARVHTRAEQMHRLSVKFRDTMLNEQRHNPQSVNNALSAIDAYCRFLHISPPAIKREARVTSEHSILTQEEVRNILAVIHSREITARDRAIFLLFLQGGISLRDCHSLNHNDLKTDETASLVHLEFGKTKQRQVLRIHKQSPLGQALLQWQNERIPTPDENALFLSTNGERLSSSSMHVIARKIGWKSRIPLSIKLVRDSGLHFRRLGIDLQ